MQNKIQTTKPGHQDVPYRQTFGLSNDSSTFEAARKCQVLQKTAALSAARLETGFTLKAPIAQQCPQTQSPATACRITFDITGFSMSFVKAAQDGSGWSWYFRTLSEFMETDGKDINRLVSMSWSAHPRSIQLTPFWDWTSTSIKQRDACHRPPLQAGSVYQKSHTCLQIQSRRFFRWIWNQSDKPFERIAKMTI